MPAPNAQEIALCAAVEAGDISKVKELLASGVTANAKDKDGWSALLNAAYCKQPEIGELLIENGANLNDLAPGSGVTPLYIACENGLDKLVAALCSHNADASIGNQSNATPLYIALQCSNEACASLIIDSIEGAKTLNIRHKLGTSSLFIACENGLSDMTAKMLERGADPLLCREEDKALPIHAASQNGHDECVKLLLYATKGSDSASFIDSQKVDGDTPLIIAAQNGRDGVCSVLLDAGANTEISNQNGVTPLLIAVYNANDSTTKILLEHKVPIKVSEKLSADIAKVFLPSLICAIARLGDLDLLDGLIRNPEISGDILLAVSSPDAVGRTAAEYARQKGHIAILNRLAAEGANVFRISGDTMVTRNAGGCGNTFLHGVVWKAPDEGAARWPITPQAWKEMVNEGDIRFGRTPLHHACYNGSESWLERLLNPDKHPEDPFDIKADPAIVDFSGWSPVHEAAAALNTKALETVLAGIDKLNERRLACRQQTYNGEIPLDLAKKAYKNGGDWGEYRAIRQILLNNGSQYFRGLTHLKRRIQLLFFSLVWGMICSPLLVSGLFAQKSSVSAVLFSLGGRKFISNVISFLAWVCIFVVVSIVQSTATVALAPYVVALLVLFQLVLAIRGSLDRRYWKVVEERSIIRMWPVKKFWRNWIPISALAFETWQLLALGVSQLSQSTSTGTSASPFMSLFQQIAMVLRAGILQITGVSVSEVIFWITAGVIVLWIWISGYIGLACYMLHPSREQTRRKWFPSITGNVLEKIPGKEFTLQFLSTVLYITLLASAFEIININTSDGWDWKWIMMLGLVMWYVPSATFVGLYLGASPHENADVRTISVFLLYQRLLKLIATAGAIFFSVIPIVATSISAFVPLLLAILVALLRPVKRNIRLNIWKCVLYVSSAGTGLAVFLSSVVGGDGMGTLSVIVALVVMGGPVIVGVVLSVGVGYCKSGSESKTVPV